MQFISCADLTIGGGAYASPPASIAQVWTSCPTTTDSAVVVGIVRGCAEVPGALEIVPAASGNIRIVDCAAQTDVVTPGDSVTLRNLLLVPSQYPTIKDAVDDALEGDHIYISPGTYAEDVVVSDFANLTIRPDVLPGTVTVNGGSGPAFTFTNCGPDLILGVSPISSGSDHVMELTGSGDVAVQVTGSPGDDHFVHFMQLVANGRIQLDQTLGRIWQCRIEGSGSPGSIGLDWQFPSSSAYDGSVQPAVENCAVSGLNTAIRMRGPDPLLNMPIWCRDDTVTASSEGIVVDQMSVISIQSCLVTGTGIPGSKGISARSSQVYVNPGAGLDHCVVENFDTGLDVWYCLGNVHHNLVRNCGTGILITDHLGTGALDVFQNTVDGFDRPGGVGFAISPPGCCTSPGVTLTHDLAVRCHVGFDCALANNVPIECSDGWENDYDFYSCGPAACVFTPCPVPVFCGYSWGDYELGQDSQLLAPALCTGTSCCYALWGWQLDHVGAFGQGCGHTSSVTQGTTESTSWGLLKTRFR